MDKKEIFKQKVFEKYGDIYDVSDVEYTNCYSYIYPYCNKHHKHFRTTGDHLLNSGQICDECKLEIQRKNLCNNFINSAIKIYGDLYDYSNVKYINEKTEVCITCRIHGDFWKKPYQHLKYYNSTGKCPVCESERKRKEYIDYCSKNHETNYDYSKLDLDNPREDGKVCIICPIHGEFWQNPSAHKGGDECLECVIDKKKMSTKTFIEKATALHNGFYIYDKTNLEARYRGGKVIVTCPIHGDFNITPNNHLRGKGCPYCAGRYKTSEMVVKEFKEAHPFDDYDYSNVIYTKATNKVEIMCKKCGKTFYQTPNKHLSGEGCPYCKSSILEKETRFFLEDNGIEYDNEHKEKWLGLLRIDYYLPYYNVAIECQGIQHFSQFKNTKDSFEEIKERDIKKYKLCNENGVKVFYYAKQTKYIPDVYIDKIYFDLNEMLDEIKKYSNK